MLTKNRFFLFYYVALILVMALHSSMQSTPMAIRLVYLAALLVPLLNKVQYLPPVLISVMVISQNSFAYPLVPDDNYYYVIISAFFALIFISQSGKSIAPKDRLSSFSLLLPVYLLVENIVLDGQVLDLTSSVFICIMLYLCASKDLSSNAKLITFAYMVFTVSMSYLLIAHPEARTIAAHGEEDATWADPNYLGGMVGIGCVLAVMSLINTKHSVFQIVFYISTIIASLSFLALMASRGAILAVGVSTIALTLFSKVKRSTKFITLIGVVGVILYVYNSEAFEVLITRFNNGDTTGTGRTLIWAAKLKGFTQEGNVLNFLFGYGAEGGFSLGFSDLGMIWAFHNDFVAVLCEYGAIGLLSYIFILSYPFRIASKKDKPVIGALLLYIITLGLTLEPVISGRFVFISYLLFIIILAKGGVQREPISL